jgi:hypothetical protein
MEQGPLIQHLAGLHVISANQTPHIYTTTGVIGDHEGPRSWIPCCDTASVKSRATHCISVNVTAPAREGLSCIGCGEDFGVTESMLHEHVSTYKTNIDSRNNNSTSESDLLAIFVEQLGADQLEFLQRLERENTTKKRKIGPHVIPMEEESLRKTETKIVSLDTIFATSVWCSHIWTPVSIRSIGFAVGPFKVLEDPEYFGPNAIEQDADDEDDDNNNVDDDRIGPTSFDNRLEALLETARSRGEGFRQAYFAPLYERKFLLTSTLDVNNTLSMNNVTQSPMLPNSQLRLSPLTTAQKEMSEMLDHVVTFATTGVPHRALSLMRDVLALPTYRTASYTQIWIPNAVHGGATSGALHHCPECLVNQFLGGAIMDSRLLPPVNARLPFYHGGRVLQFLQARSAIRGWITAAIPIGGHDDVGTGYLFTLIESFIMSLYERGHGAFGEGNDILTSFFTPQFCQNRSHPQTLPFHRWCQRWHVLLQKVCKYKRFK